MRLIPSAYAFITVSCVMPFARAQTGGIQGTVSSLIPGTNGSAAHGPAVPGTRVYYRRTLIFAPRKGRGQAAQLAPGEVSFDKSTPADARGEHSVTGLPVGTYVVCAAVAGQAYLNPCEWSISPSVRVQSGVISKLDFELEKGVFLKVHIDDPQKLLPVATKTPFDPPHLIVGVVFGNGAFLAASRKNADVKGQDYEIPVRTGVPLYFWLFSRHVALADSQGKPLPISGAAVPFTAVPGVDQAFGLRVTGSLQ